MKKTLLLLLSFATIPSIADITDYLNFATTMEATDVESVLFRNNGRLTFTDDGMRYQDQWTTKTISYEYGTYIFFTETEPIGVVDLEDIDEPKLIYSATEGKIKLIGTQKNAAIRLVCIDGRLLTTAEEVQEIATSNLQPGIVIATAQIGSKRISKTFVIK